MGVTKMQTRSREPLHSVEIFLSPKFYVKVQKSVKIKIQSLKTVKIAIFVYLDLSKIDFK